MAPVTMRLVVCDDCGSLSFDWSKHKRTCPAAKNGMPTTLLTVVLQAELEWRS